MSSLWFVKAMDAKIIGDRLVDYSEKIILESKKQVGEFIVKHAKKFNKKEFEDDKFEHLYLVAKIEREYAEKNIFGKVHERKPVSVRYLNTATCHPKIYGNLLDTLTEEEYGLIGKED